MKKFFLSLVLLSLSFSTVSAFADTVATTDSDVPTITVRKNDVVWRYKVVNGNLYKRQYDNSAGKWLGNWVLA